MRLSHWELKLLFVTVTSSQCTGTTMTNSRQSLHHSTKRMNDKRGGEMTNIFYINSHGGNLNAVLAIYSLSKKIDKLLVLQITIYITKEIDLFMPCAALAHIKQVIFYLLLEFLGSCNTKASS